MDLRPTDFCWWPWGLRNPVLLHDMGTCGKPKTDQEEMGHDHQSPWESSKVTGQEKLDLKCSLTVTFLGSNSGKCTLGQDSREKVTPSKAFCYMPVTLVCSECICLHHFLSLFTTLSSPFPPQPSVPQGLVASALPIPPCSEVPYTSACHLSFSRQHFYLIPCSLYF
jgi:hypothetical protein